MLPGKSDGSGRDKRISIMARKKLFSRVGSHTREREEWEYDEYDNGYNDEYEDWEESYNRHRREDRRRWLRWAVPVMAALVVVVAALGVTMVYASQVTGRDTIYPNVSINGVAVGGLTVEEAEEKLGTAEANPYTDAEVKVLFPLDNTLTITARELGISQNARVPAETAYAYGRDGSAFHNLQVYLACKKKPVELDWDVETLMDEEALEKRVSAMVTTVNQKLLNAEADIREDGVVIIKGMSAVMVDGEEVCQMVKQAFIDRDFRDIQCQVKVIEEKKSATSTGTKNAANSKKTEDYSVLQSVYDAIYTEPENAMYDKETGGATKAKRGVSFDMEAAKKLWDKAALGDEIFIPFLFTEPEIDEEALMERLFADCLSKKSTTLSGSSSNRINNITLAAQAMNGTVINPGETFDYNSCLGQRTTAKGYREAGAYANGQHVTNVGGGICQPSSTLYYCALYANLKITVRECHYFVVSYLPWGMDATVSWGGPDFRFVNNREYPIKIKAWVSDGYLTVELWGTDEDGSYVKITSDTWEDSEFYYAQTYRTVYDVDGNQISSAKEAYSRYHKYEAGEETPPPAEEDEPDPTPTKAPDPVVTTEPDPVTPPPQETTEPDPVTPPPQETTEPDPVTPPPQETTGPEEGGSEGDGGE